LGNQSLSTGRARKVFSSIFYFLIPWMLITSASHANLTRRTECEELHELSKEQQWHVSYNDNV